MVTVLKKGLVCVAMLALAAGCGPSPTPVSPTAGGAGTLHPVIAEVMAGASGNNSHEFIELYNPTSQVIDLDGWSLWYRLSSSTHDLLVYQWRARALVAGHGHYLLVRQGQDVGATADAFFAQGLNTSSGGLALRDSGGNTVDSLGWGSQPITFTEGQPAPADANDHALERRPGGAGGNASDTNDNASDFALNAAPNPENSGDAPAASRPSPLAFTSELKASIQPGQTAALVMRLSNHGATTLQHVVATVPVPKDFEITSVPEGVSNEANTLTWSLDTLDPGQAAERSVELRAPWAFESLPLQNQTAMADGLPGPVLAAPSWITVEKGPVPITIARSLINQEVIVEGVATMYTGGLYAGSGSTKFYMQDSSGAVQVYVPGGGSLDVPIGAKVSVQGKIQPYRNTIELVPDSPEAVQTLSTGSAPQPADTGLAQVLGEPDSVAGQLLRIQGDLTDIQDQSYSYDLTLADDQGQTLEVYVDKQTNLQVETLNIDQPYFISGIFETPDGVPTLYPRLQTDFQQDYANQLVVTTQVPANISSGGAFDVQATLANHTGQDLHDVSIGTEQPEGATLLSIANGGHADGTSLTWTIQALANGQDATLGYRVQVKASSGSIKIPSFSAAGEGGVAASSDARRVFIGDTVPIGAIQGPGARSPYVLQTLTTEGVVTGVFPELGGFWIQSQVPDQDPATSEGLFVNDATLPAGLSLGDLVRVKGRVRELSLQTQLQVSSAADVTTLKTGLSLPKPVSWDPPIDDTQAQTYNEQLEGMLVDVTQPAVAVGPTSRYGEYTLVRSSLGIGRIMHGQPAGERIVVDDGSDSVHDDSSGLPYVVKVGDVVTGLEGPLAFTFGQFKIEPIHPPKVTQASLTLPKLPATPSGQVRLMTWNVENLFDTVVPHPSDPPLPTKAQYDRDLAKVAATIIQAGAPTVVAMQEVENIGILEDLAALDQLAPYAYKPYLMEGTDSRGIDVGYLVRSDQAQVVSERQIPSPDGLMSRPPLLIQLKIQAVPGIQTVTLINNHFTSMSAGVENTRPRRTQQAQVNADAVQQILNATPNAMVGVMGDLNSFFDSPPIQTLRQAGLTHVLDSAAPAQRYDYNYQGISQELDHILVSKSLSACMTQATVMHLDAEYPPAAPNDMSPIHKSDHDPLVASFSCSP